MWAQLPQVRRAQDVVAVDTLAARRVHLGTHPTMKKLERTHAGIDYVKLFADHARRTGVGKYTEQAITQFGDDFERSLLLSSQAEHRVRGLRAEALFVAVVAAIGKVK